MILTRQEKEKQILDLYNQGYTYKQIAQMVRVSPRDIKPVLEKAERERERGKELESNSQERHNGRTENLQTQTQTQTQKAYVFSQAYRLFSEGKTPWDVAIELNVRQPQATRYHREFWKLKQLHSLNMVYEEIGDDGIIHLLKLYRKIREAGMGVDQAVILIKNAKSLPTLEEKCQKLKREVDSLEFRKLEADRILTDLHDQIDMSEKMLKCLETACQEEEDNIDQLESEKIRLKRLVKQFKHNDEEYLKIERKVQSKITNLLSDGKGILIVALDSLMQSMRTDPQKYINLINYNQNSSTRQYGYNTGYINGQQPYASFNNFYEDKSTLLDDAEKLFNKLVKELTEQMIKEYLAKK
jgi:transposase-like protein